MAKSNPAANAAAVNALSTYGDLAISAIGSRYPIVGSLMSMQKDVLVGFLGDSLASQTGAGGYSPPNFGVPGRVTIRVDGLAQTRRAFGAIGPDLNKELRQALKEAVDHAARDARLLAPRRTGRLAAGYRPGTSGASAFVRNRVPYARVHEYGGTIAPRGTPITIRRSAPLGRAVQRQEDAIMSSLEDGIDRIAGRHGFR